MSSEVCIVSYNICQIDRPLTEGVWTQRATLLSDDVSHEHHGGLLCLQRCVNITIDLPETEGVWIQSAALLSDDVSHEHHGGLLCLQRFV